MVRASCVLVQPFPLRSLLASVAVGLLVGVVACTNDFSIPSGAPLAPPPKAGSATSDAAATGGDAGAADAATTSTAAGDAGDTRADAATPGGKKANGASCAENDEECASGLCARQRGDGIRAGYFCTIECDLDDKADPTCAGAAFTGICGSDGECIVK